MDKAGWHLATWEAPAEEKELSARVFRLIPAMNFLSKSRSMAVRLPSGVDRLAESRSMLDKTLWGLFMVGVGLRSPRVGFTELLLCL